jgi:beta-lactamase regulating signal transducer with metallopeptidase domain
MNALFIPAHVVDRLGWVLVHSLWQFMLIALAAAFVLHAMRRRSSHARYGALLAFFSVMLASPLATWLVVPESASAGNSVGSDRRRHEIAVGDDDQATDLVIVSRLSRNPVEPAEDANRTAPREGGATWRLSIAERLEPWLSLIVSVWCFGVLAFACRPLVSWHTLHRLRRVGVSPAPETAQRMLDRTAQSLGLRWSVQVLQSTLVQVPLVVGHLRPVVLLPVAIVTGLPASQLEAILAHELAHIRRHDFFVNLIQVVVETLFFYHPAVWWLSRRIRAERENCCDDVAVALLGSGAIYGRALLALEELRSPNAALGVAATGGSLLARVRRLAGQERQSCRAGAEGLVLLGALSIGIVAAGLWARATAADDAAQPQKEQNLAQPKERTAGATDRGTRAAEERDASLDIIVAKHVLLWNEKIMTWDEVATGLRALREQEGKPIYPLFRVTGGALAGGRWATYRDDAVSLYKELAAPGAPSARRFAAPASDRYDLIRTAADFAPRPEDTRVGIVKSAAERPVSVASVILMAENFNALFRTLLNEDMSLADPQAEAWTRTDRDGRFRLVAPDSGHLLAVLSPSGFAFAPVPKPGEEAEIKLSPLAEIEIVSADESKQRLTLNIDPAGEPDACPGFVMHGVSIGAQPKTLRLPAGRVIVRREVKMTRGIRSVNVAEQVHLKPGEKKKVSVQPPDPGTESQFQVQFRVEFDGPFLSEKAVQSLAKPTTVDFTETALEDALNFLKDYHDLSLRIDRDAVQAEGISLDRPVTMKAAGATFHWVLKSLLEPADLDYFIDAEGLVITTKEKAEPEPGELEAEEKPKR